MTQNNSLSIDSASPALLLTGCFLCGLILFAINPTLPIFASLLALAPAMVASEKGREPLNWWCYGFLLFIVAILHAVNLPTNQPKVALTKRKFWRGVRFATIVIAIFCIISSKHIEEGSPTLVFTGISFIASTVLSIVAWTQKI